MYDFGLTVRLERTRRGWGQEGFAKLAGIGRGTLSRIESGRVRPQARIRQRILRALGATMPMELTPSTKRPRCACGALLPAPGGNGRPRKRCDTCASDKAALGRSWRAENAGAVATYNGERRAWRCSHPAEVDARNAARRRAYALAKEEALERRRRLFQFKFPRPNRSRRKQTK